MTGLVASPSVSITEVRGGRRDVEITGDLIEFSGSDAFSALRRLFADIDSEAQAHSGQPVPLVQALAHLDALVADLRLVRDNVKRYASDALAGEKVRRLVVHGVCTVESVTETARTGWRHPDLMHALMQGTGHRLVCVETGEVFDAQQSTDWLLSVFTPAWKITGLREHGIDPDDWCDVPRDDYGNTVRTHTVRLRANGKRD